MQIRTSRVICARLNSSDSGSSGTFTVRQHMAGKTRAPVRRRKTGTSFDFHTAVDYAAIDVERGPRWVMNASSLTVRPSNIDPVDVASAPRAWPGFQPRRNVGAEQLPACSDFVSGSLDHTQIAPFRR